MAIFLLGPHPWSRKAPNATSQIVENKIVIPNLIFFENELRFSQDIALWSWPVFYFQDISQVI